jgi:hypothetical protein
MIIFKFLLYDISRIMIKIYEVNILIAFKNSLFNYLRQTTIKKLLSGHIILI